MRGYFGIGIFNIKTEMNLGTLWRSAYQLGANFIFTIGKRYKKMGSDTYKTFNQIPLYHYIDFDDFRNHIPFDCVLIGIEKTDNARQVENFCHPKKCIYLLGAEDNGLPIYVLERCNHIISLGSINHFSYNVAVTGSIVMYDRYIKNLKGSEK